MDPFTTGYLLRDEFEEILKELCPELNRQETEYICSKYESLNDGRINYIDFLAPYAPKRNREKPTDTFREEEEFGHSSSRLDMNDPLIIKLRTAVKNFQDLCTIFYMFIKYYKII